MEEIWKNIKEFENYYQISNLNRVKSLARYDKRGYRIKERILKLQVNNAGYFSVNLWVNCKHKTCLMHRLVAEAFIPNFDNKPQINHRDGGKLNNRVNNLEWCTAKENITHAINTGLRNTKGEAHGRARLTEDAIIRIRESVLTLRKLAEIFKVSYQQIGYIKNNKRWRHI